VAKPKRRVTRKQLLKEPDEFITVTGRLIEFTRNYQNQLLYGAAAVVGVVILAYGFMFYGNWKEDKAVAMLDQAVSQYQKAKEDKADLTPAQDAFQAVLKKYSGTEGGKLARVIYANICYETGRYDTAIDLYTKALEDFTGHPTFMPLIQSSLGYTHEAKKDYAAAASFFEILASETNPILKDAALYNLGLIYAILGKPEKSKAAFAKIESDHADSAFKELAAEQTRG
jgi:tetratricopeptide (TPR) repeat protein